MLKIGHLAGRLGLNVRTLRYYESIGLLPPPKRTGGGYRLYSEADERRRRFVLQAKRVGLSLEEIGRILELRRHGSACDYVRETVARHIETIDSQIAALQRLRATLLEVVSRGPQPGEEPGGGVCRLIEQRASSSITTITDEEAPMATLKAEGGSLRRRVPGLRSDCAVGPARRLSELRRDDTQRQR